MKLINNAEEWEKFYYYAPKYKPEKYPQSYPCFIDRVYMDGGLAGDYTAHNVIYIPDTLATKHEQDAFKLGLHAKSKFVWS